MIGRLPGEASCLSLAYAFWAFSFPFAAAVTYVHWLAAEHVHSGTALGYALVGVLTAGSRCSRRGQSPA